MLTAIISAAADGWLKMWNAGDLSLAGRHHVHERGVLSMALSADGLHVATTGGDNHLRIWSIGNRIVAEAGGSTSEKPLSAVVWSRDKQQLITGGLDKMVRFWNVRDLTESRKPLPAESSVTALAVTAN